MIFIITYNNNFKLAINSNTSRFDPSGRGELTDKEMYNVLKIMNKIDINQEQV